MLESGTKCVISTILASFVTEVMKRKFLLSTKRIVIYKKHINICIYYIKRYIVF